MRRIEAVGSNGRMVLDAETLTISRKGAGFLTTINLGLQGDKLIPVAQITAVELRPPGAFFKGYIRLSINGRDPIGGAADAVRDENAVLIDRKHLPAFNVLRNQLVKMIGRPRGGSAPSFSSIADEIEKLAGLRDRGILSEDEFANKKRRLLDE